eukprot:14432052-Heterocapsa_arctica.AAC.1
MQAFPTHLGRLMNQCYIGSMHPQDTVSVTGKSQLASRPARPPAPVFDMLIHRLPAATACSLSDHNGV